ncbi:MAG: hypothetical protein JSS79_17725 [Bacteroidetes bacterium]|nr:hypothetical protein [Bacteroidota bacterium]
MKTKKRFLSVKGASALVAILFGFLASCQNNGDILSANDTQNVNAESASGAYANESSDIASSAVGGMPASQYSGARVESETVTGLGSKDDRLQCATVTITRTGTKDAPAGTIIIDYGTAGTCADSHGVIRKGKITITYSGKRWMLGSTVSITLDGYYRNDTHIEGTLTLTTQLSADSLHLQFQSQLVDGKITFGDGKFITRTHNLTREWIRSSLPFNDEWVTLANTGSGTNGEASGTTKDGGTYSMQITKSLIEKIACRAKKVFIPVSGTKVMMVGNAQYTVDYGDGTCDNIITVTLNGKTKQITVTAEGN